METVLTDLLFLVIRVGDGVEERLLGHRRVELSVEHRHLRHMVSQQLDDGADPLEVDRIVQRRKLGALLDPPHDIVVDPDGLPESFAAVNDTVTDGADIVERSKSCSL